MKHIRLSTLAASVALSLISSSSLAAGFQIVEHSANGLGRAFAGEAATAENAAVIARNPAAMSRFDKTAISAVLSYVEPEVGLEGTVTNKAAAGEGLPDQFVHYEANEEEFAPSATVPAFYALTPLNEQVHIGLGIFTNFGLSTDYSDDFNALEYGDKTELTTVNINPSLSYKLTEQFSLGLGINAVYADASLSTTTPLYFNSNPAMQAAKIPGGITIAQVSGDGWDWGWNVGVLWAPIEGTDLALTYRSGVDIKLKGKMSSIDPRFKRETKSGSLDLNLPDITELAINHQLSDQLSVQASLNYMGWNSFEKLEVDVDTLGPISLKEENFKNSWRISTGITYQYNHKWTLRAGLAYDKSPVQDDDRTISIPDSDRKWFSTGASYQLDTGSSIDLAFTYIKGSSASLKEDDFPEKKSPLTELNAELTKIDAYVFAAGYNIQF